MRFTTIKKEKIYNFRIFFAIMIIVLVVIFAFFAKLLAPFDPYKIHLSKRLCSVSIENWFGCDMYGSDLLSQIIFGARTSLIIAVTTSLITTFTGVLLGIICGFFGGKIDSFILHLSEVLMAFPGILLIMCMSIFLGTDYVSIIFALTITAWPAPTRIVRAEVLRVKNLDYVQFAIAMGASKLHLALKYFLPSVYSQIWIYFSFSMAGVILVESSLSFLGFGVQQNISWGALINQGRSVIFEAPHLSFFPGIILFVLILSFNFIGDALRDAFDPRS